MDFAAAGVIGRADAGLAGAWVQGWARARELGPARAIEGGFYIHVGASDQEARYVFASIEAKRLHDFAASITTPKVFLKLFADVSALAPVLPAPWVVRDPRTMMIADLKAAPPPALPCGYRLVRETRSGVVTLTIADKDAVTIAHGKLAIENGHAVFDRIRSHENHRRLGLARAIMLGLTAEAVQLSATLGVLVATAEGRALYSTLGWCDYSPYASAVIEAPGE